MNQPANNRIVRYRREFRATMVALGAPLVLLGAWAVVAPRSWFDDFPGLGRHWVSAIGPYNEHLATDVGAFFLALGGLVVFAAFVLDRRLVQGALGALVVYSVPHLVYHLTELDVYSTTDKILNLISLGLLVVVPLGLLALTREKAQAGELLQAPRMQAKREVTYGTH
jgi:hypothetical protein